MPPSTDNIKGDTFRVILGPHEPFTAGVSHTGGPDAHPVRAQRAGTTIIGMLVQGQAFAAELDVQEATAQMLQTYYSCNSNGVPAAVGGLLPTVPLTIQHVSDTNGSDALYCPKFAITSVRQSPDGREEARWLVSGEGVADDDGIVYRIGVPS